VKDLITVHCRVRNEERFIKAAILSVLPLAHRVLVYDTGSTDRTLAEIRSIGSDKIELVEKAPSDPRGIMEYRNEMIERTETEWFMLVDGDEIYPAHSVRRILEEMQNVPSSVHRITLRSRHFFTNFNFVYPDDRIGRIYRTGQIRWQLFDPSQNEVGHETVYWVTDPSQPVPIFSMDFPSDILFYHLHHLPRSSRDGELERLRGWRKAGFPIMPYTGPWPELLDLRDVAQSLTAPLMLQCLKLNAAVLARNPWHTTRWLVRRFKRQVREARFAMRDEET
jgi:glycosyltransferase involved in cell wall biosynthesis